MASDCFRIVEIIENYTVQEQSLQILYWHVWNSVRQSGEGLRHRVPVCPIQYPNGEKCCIRMLEICVHCETDCYAILCKKSSYRAL